MCNYYDKQTEIPEVDANKTPPVTHCVECGDPLNFDELSSKICLSCKTE